MVQNQAYQMADEITGYIVWLPENIQQLLNNKSPSNTEVNTSQNQILEMSTFKNLILFVIICMIVSYMISQYDNINIFNVIKHIILGIIFMGITEYIFLKLVISNYMSADTNYIKYTLLTKLKDSENLN